MVALTGLLRGRRELSGIVPDCRRPRRSPRRGLGERFLCGLARHRVFVLFGVPGWAAVRQCGERQRAGLPVAAWTRGIPQNPHSLPRIWVWSRHAGEHQRPAASRSSPTLLSCSSDTPALSPFSLSLRQTRCIRTVTAIPRVLLGARKMMRIDENPHFAIADSSDLLARFPHLDGPGPGTASALVSGRPTVATPSRQDRQSKAGAAHTSQNVAP